MARITFTVPENLAREAKEAGLLTPDVIERLLREELRRVAVDRMFDAADRLASLKTPPLTASEVEAEIQAARSQRR